MFSLLGPTPPRATLRLGLGQRQLSRISLFFILIVGASVIYGAYHVFLGFKAARDIVIAKDNEAAIYKAFREYALDWEGKLPPVDHWSDSVAAELPSASDQPGGKMAYLHGPGSGREVGYVYNSLAAGYDFNPTSSFIPSKHAPKAQVPADALVLIIEKPGAPMNTTVAIPPQNTEAGRQALYKLLSFPHGVGKFDDRKTVILYANGHIEVDTPRDFQD